MGPSLFSLENTKVAITLRAGHIFHLRRGSFHLLGVSRLNADGDNGMFTRPQGWGGETVTDL